MTVFESFCRSLFSKVIYELLALIEFTSSRKRMSVLVKTKEGKILLLSKVGVFDMPNSDPPLLQGRRQRDHGEAWLRPDRPENKGSGNDWRGETWKFKSTLFLEADDNQNVCIQKISTLFQFAREGLRTMALGMREARHITLNICIIRRLNIWIIRRLKEFCLRCLKRNMTVGKEAGMLLGFSWREEKKLWISNSEN